MNLSNKYRLYAPNTHEITEFLTQHTWIHPTHYIVPRNPCLCGQAYMICGHNLIIREHGSYTAMFRN